MKSLQNYTIKKKNVLLRVDLNVPVINGKIIDDTRLLNIRSTIEDLVNGKNKIFLISHFGRPKGKFIKKFSLEFLIPILKRIFKIKNISFLNSYLNKEISEHIKNMKYGEICLLENVRFYKYEESNDSKFSRNIAKNFDFYVNDAFSCSHRSHSSIDSITNFLPSLAGNSLLKEIKNLELLFDKKISPMTAIIGGSKISTKLLIIHNLIETFDKLIIVGAMANTFLYSQGYKVGKSLIEKNLRDEVKKILHKAKSQNVEIILPIDLICSNNIKDQINIKFVDINNILPDQMALDIGSKTIKLIEEKLLKSNMILWNGPCGAFEFKPFDYGTNQIAEIIKKNSKALNILTIAGGGDTVAAIKKCNAENAFTYISTAGGAFLEWIEGKDLPGIKALKNNKLF